MKNKQQISAIKKETFKTQIRMRGKRESGKRRFTRKKNSMKKLVITISKVEKHVVVDSEIKLAKAKTVKEKLLKL